MKGSPYSCGGAPGLEKQRLEARLESRPPRLYLLSPITPGARSCRKAGRRSCASCSGNLGGGTNMATDEQTRLELEAAVYRRLVEHLRTRTDVQNIDLMNLAGFCRNCLSNWMKDAADEKGVAMSKDESREIVYGMPYDEWRTKHQKESSPAQKAAFEKASQKH
jgi:uncharacterized protein